MVALDSLVSLWLPILLSAVAVFILSALVHMVLGYHKNDYTSLPDEDGVLNALRPFNIPPGQYVMPRPKSMAEMKDPAYLEKARRGPVAFMTVLGGWTPGMGKQLFSWFIYTLVVSAVAGCCAAQAYAGDHGTAGPGMKGSVFCITGTIAFVAYGFASWPETIWYKRKLSMTLKSTFDGLLYALATAAIFYLLWP